MPATPHITPKWNGNSQARYYCFPQNAGDVVATRLATEELYKLARSRTATV